MNIESFTSPVISLEVHEHVGTLWLDRPESANAMGTSFWQDFPTAVTALDAAPEVRVIVIAAKGKHFSAGLDLVEMAPELLGATTSAKTDSQAMRNRERFEAIVKLQQAISSVTHTNKPVIAAVHGSCIGGGVDLIAACDCRFASADAVFSVREARIAIVADLGSLQRLGAIIGAGHLAELALSAKDIDAQHAYRIGLVNDAQGDAEDVYVRAVELAREIAANSPLAVQGTKAVLRANDGRSIDEGLAYVATWNSLYLESADLTEAITAFFEHRPPHFTGA